MNTTDRLDAAHRLIKVVTGEPYGDGDTVTDSGIGYAEPGYHDNETVWVLGDWNDKTRYEDGERIVTSTAPSRLFDALKRIDVQGEWSDEWIRCGDCYRIVREKGDSYSWKPYFHIWDGEVSCGDCLQNMGADALEDFINNPHLAVTWASSHHLESLGWSRYNPRQYENGFHPGQNDQPAKVLAEVQESMPGHDVIFYMDESSQFYLGFSAFTRAVTSGDCPRCNSHDDDLSARGGICETCYLES